MEKLKNRFRYFKEKRMTVLVLLFLLLLNVLLILGGCLFLHHEERGVCGIAAADFHSLGKAGACFGEVAEVHVAVAA